MKEFKDGLHVGKAFAKILLESLDEEQEEEEEEEEGEPPIENTENLTEEQL